MIALALLAAIAAPPIHSAPARAPVALVSPAPNADDGAALRKVTAPDGSTYLEFVDDIGTPQAPVLLADASPAPTPTLEPVSTSTPPIVPGAPTDVSSALQLVPQMIAAFQAGKTLIGIGLLLMLLVFIVTDLFWKDVEASKYKALIIAAIGAVGTTAAALVAGQPLLPAAEAGGEAGLIAAGGWEVVGQHLLPLASAAVRWVLAKVTGKSAPKPAGS